MSLIRIILLKSQLFFRRRKQSGGGVAAEALGETESEDDAAPSETASAGPEDASPARYNSKGYRITANGNFSMRELDLASLVPPKTRAIDAPRFFNASLSFSKAFTVASVIINGKHMPVEKHRDGPNRLILLHTAAQFSLSKDQLDTILEADPVEMGAYVTALARNTQQVVRYTLYGQFNNYMNEKVLTPRDVFPSDDVKLHLGLTGENQRKSFMDL